MKKQSFPKMNVDNNTIVSLFLLICQFLEWVQWGEGPRGKC